MNFTFPFFSLKIWLSFVFENWFYNLHFYSFFSIFTFFYFHQQFFIFFFPIFVFAKSLLYLISFSTLLSFINFFSFLPIFDHSFNHFSFLGDFCWKSPGLWVIFYFLAFACFPLCDFFFFFFFQRNVALDQVHGDRNDERCEKKTINWFSENAVEDACHFRWNRLEDEEKKKW